MTLDDDVAARLKEFARSKGISFKEAVNLFLRRGFGAQDGPPARRPHFQAQVFDSPFRPGIDPLRLNQLVDDLEAEDSLTPDAG